MRISQPLLICLCFASVLNAQEITFEADESLLYVRSYDSSGDAIIEFLGEAGARYQCVVLDADAQPIATSSAIADLGKMIVNEISADLITDVKCRRTR